MIIFPSNRLGKLMSYKLRSRIVKCLSNRDCCDVNEKPDQNFGQEIFSLKGRGKVMITTQKTAKASTALHRSVRILGDNEVVYLAGTVTQREHIHCSK
jgi:hypothetical protein